ncbi:TetR/AcrR family transcriptional regulator [Arthrobacter sp. MYb211]|uniref:TetR/AcrR family transcriptional regulator n=1 Tax=Micrococcaceae TaxID=1268 RepID=UPI000BB807BD|nr:MULTISPECIES: TetR/AcrR family transcriptional regulator [Micrococcaceae]PCC27385.1 TetR family transcriptional regulator [Glutamicibacter sp. BW80]PRA00099.1 TetR/AcrR family transcriptional regulator [Arthrobacter sp. MYb224]PRA04274.1 TetR/AcrR family transcriptional regulator [Arthrobacter sp. MYb229]PRA11535.1 TetR/AcrR family transcriptional regulator [Arthrobacter sp. MYb221]PRB51815.1 TetR/AcrR family transcriptional regulator [Arthrobacter sp. MYb216]
MDIDQVQRAAVARFAQQGFAATGIRELGTAAGINSATLYHYVGSKQDLLMRIISDCLNAMIAGGRAAIAGEQQPTRQLARLIAFHVAFTATNPLTARVAEYEMRALTGPAQEQMQALRDHYESLFSKVLAAGQAAGEFATDDLTMARLAVMEMGTGVAHWYRPDGRLSLSQVQQNFVAMAYRILAVTEAPQQLGDLLAIPRRLASEPATIQAQQTVS